MDLEGEKPTKDDKIAMDIIKKMKWSLNGDPAIAAKEDAAEFLRVAAKEKTHPDFEIKNLVMASGSDSFNNFDGIEKELKAKGMTDDQISDLILKEPADSPFKKNPSLVYSKTAHEVLGNSFDEYWEKVLGPIPTWFDGGIKPIGDLIIPQMNDPKSYEFVRFINKPSKYNGIPAWEIDYYYRGKNAFGAKILTHHIFYMRDGQVIGVKEPKQ